MDADEMKKKFDLFFCCKSYTALSLFLWDNCPRAELILARLFKNSLATLYQFYVINEMRK